MNYAYDCHMHLLPLSHVCLSAYLDYAQKNPLSEAYAQVSAHDYVLGGIIKRQGEARNLVAVMEQPVAKQLALYEDDLRSKYASENRAIITNEGVKIAGGGGKNLCFEKIVVCPQIMDFSFPQKLNLYYSDMPVHDIITQAKEILCGIEEFYKKNPHSLMEVKPFFGINPLHYSEEKIREVLKEAFPKKNIFSKNKVSFVGIKVYPPMGFDPNPDDEKLRARNEVLFSFCEEQEIPIVTHCDDQGFRMVPLEDSFKYTSPERWRPVLERHPNLYLDFAHFGSQYYRGAAMMQFKEAVEQMSGQKTDRRDLSWREQILLLMKTFPHVYSDLSFGGVNSSMWKNVLEVLKNAGEEERAVYSSRLLFGTDWPLSLVKIPSALDYWRGFAESEIDSELAKKILCQNPQSFLR